MSGEVEAAFQAIALNRVPAAWAAASYPSMLSLGAYLADLAARVAMFQAHPLLSRAPMQYRLGECVSCLDV